jgi:hypothetical protein
MISLARGLQGMRLSEVHFIQVPVVPYPKNPNWVQWAPDSSKLFSAISHDRKLPRQHRPAHKEATEGHPDGGRAATPAASNSSGSASTSPSGPQPAARRVPPNITPGLSHLGSRYGGITARANVCRDSGAFAGPLGGH